VPTLLGRWSIETCNVKLSNRIELSNEDHCGPCGEYTTTKKSDELVQNKIGLSKEQNSS
jgi:hypothetical protein